MPRRSTFSRPPPSQKSQVAYEATASRTAARCTKRLGAINTYQVFKIIMGCIAAAFILAASIQIAGTYTDLQGSFRSSRALASLLSTAADVQRTGNPASLSRLPDFTFDGEAILAGPDRVTVRTALLLVPGESLFVDAQRLDLGWWNLRSASATPQQRFVFSFDGSDPHLLDAARALAAALPNSANFEPKTTFALCSGASMLPCAGACEREDFRSLLVSLPPLQPCTNPDAEKLITFSDACVTGLCIEPPTDGFTPALADGVRVTAKDPVDLAALALGGIALFDSKNRHFGAELSLAARTRAAQAELLAAGLEDAVAFGDLAEGSDAAACIPAYRSFASAAEALPPLLGDQWHRSPAAAVTRLGAIRSAFQSLRNLGCTL